MKDGGYSTLTEAERWNYHAYDYGWRRVFLSNHGGSSPIDPDGRWFDNDGATQAERMFLAQRSIRTEPRITPAERAAARGDHELAARFRTQDRARAEAMALIEGDGKLSDGTWSPASLAFSALCRAQANANAEHFQKSTAAPQRHSVTTMSLIQQALGIKATATDEAAE
jgi:hypothetical protein